jgi:hypothetical protein
MPGLKIESHHRTAFPGTNELNTEFFDEWDVETKCACLTHVKPYLAPAVCVNELAGTILGTMNANAATILRFAATFLASIIIGLPAAWTLFAIWYQAPGGPGLRAVIVIFWVLFCLAILMSLWHGRAALSMLAFFAAFAAVLFWWHRIEPRNDRVWTDEVAQVTTGSVKGNEVTLRNVRNFDWRSDADYTQRWEARTYLLEQLDSVDMIMSYWSGAAIAHMLVSFGFEDGQHVAFTVGIRPEKKESYSELGGFFKKYELSVIAADERDVIRVRTNVRGEDDYLYRIKMPRDAMRSLFLAYVAEADSLKDSPRFYNTITTNCTTLVYHMMKRIVGYLPLSYKILLTGYLPEYVYKVGGLDQRYSLQDLRDFGRITERAKKSNRNSTFSEDIRRGIPVLDSAD